MVHKRPKIALIRVVSVTGYSLSFILLCLAASIQMRWVPASHGKSAKASQCLPPSGSDHLKLSARDAAPGTETLSFVHPGLKKDDLLPKFATTKVAKKNVTQRPAPLGVKSSLVSRASHKPKQRPRQSAPAEEPKTATLPVWPRHERPRFGPVNITEPQVSSVHSSATPRPATRETREKQAALLAGTSSQRGHHTPPAFTQITPPTVTARAHHTPDEVQFRAVAAPQPTRKPTAKQTGPVSIGTIVDPASAVPEPARQNLNKEKKTASAAGFALTGAARPKRKKTPTTRQTSEKAPVFREKPTRPKLPTSADKCLSYALYYEARHEGSEAQLGLAKVIMSRVKSKHYPNTVCGVVYQNAHLRGRCAFSFACDGLLEQPESSLAWSKAQALATQTLCGFACAAQKGKTPSVQNARKRANRTLTTGSVSARQITDRQMKHMGRDGVNGMPHKITPVF